MHYKGWYREGEARVHINVSLFFFRLFPRGPIVPPPPSCTFSFISLLHVGPMDRLRGVSRAIKEILRKTPSYIAQIVSKTTRKEQFGCSGSNFLPTAERKTAQTLEHASFEIYPRHEKGRGKKRKEEEIQFQELSPHPPSSSFAHASCAMTSIYAKLARKPAFLPTALSTLSSLHSPKSVRPDQ